MEWSDEAIVLSARRHGETSAVVEVLTLEQGRYAGLVHGATSRRLRPVLQPGNRVRASWRARLSEHLGTLSLEGDHLRIGAVLDDPERVDGLMAACELARLALPEREPHAAVFEGLDILVGALTANAPWTAVLVKWEAGLLGDLGYGLDLDRCALTGADEVTHVSPSSGRAVNGTAPEAERYLDRLLPLPAFLLGSQAAVTDADVAAGLALTGHFLERRLLWPADRQLPEARGRLVGRLNQATGGSP